MSLHNLGLDCHSVIIRSEPRRTMHHSSTGIIRNVRISQYAEATVLPPRLKVVEQGHILNTHQLRTLESLLKVIGGGCILLLGGVEIGQTTLCQHKVSLVLMIVHPHILERGMHHQRQIGGQGPWCRCPSHKTGIRVGHVRERDVDRGIQDLLVILLRLEVTQDGVASITVGHDLAAPVDVTLVPQLLEDPPHTLHELQVQRLVIVVKINPTASASNDLTPLTRITHHDAPTLRIVLCNTHLLYIIHKHHTTLYTSFLCLMPNVLSISNSTGRP